MEISRLGGWIKAAAEAGLHHSHRNTRSLTHWKRPRIKPAPAQRLCWVFNLLSHNGNLFIISDPRVSFHYTSFGKYFFPMISWGGKVDILLFFFFFGCAQGMCKYPSPGIEPMLVQRPELLQWQHQILNPQCPKRLQQPIFSAAS